MNPWQPASREEVEGLLAEAVEALHPAHRRRFEAIRVPTRRIAVTGAPGEHVFVVAEYQGKVLYYSDEEDGWELEPLNGSGGITERGYSQFELSHLTHQMFGDPEGDA
jgi:hypothetical protein